MFFNSTPRGPVAPGGYFVRPTVFGKVNPKSTIGQEEIFGPVLSIITYKDEDDAIRIANDSDYGLAGSVWTADIAHGLEIAGRVRSNPRTASIPIIMVTAKGEEIDQVVGLTVGADDYVAKPFSMKVLLARVQAVLRSIAAGSRRS